MRIDIVEEDRPTVSHQGVTQQEGKESVSCCGSMRYLVHNLHQWVDSGEYSAVKKLLQLCAP